MRNVSSTVQLQDALRKLEAFSRKAAEQAHETPLSKTMGIVRSFWQKPPPPDHEQKELLQAVEVVNRERLKIQKMQRGSPAEQKLAVSLTSAIEAYNRHALKKPLKGKGLGKFFSDRLVTIPELPKIHLPQHQLTVTYHFPSNMAQEHATQCAMNAIKPMALALSKQSAELFQMKVLALLERYGIASNPEARAVVKQTPITLSKADEEATCMLTQTLSLFPGQTIVVKGRTQLDPKTLSISRLFPETFFVSLESKQTGFPHPSQRTGWALMPQLLPECPQRMDLLQEAAGLFQRKKSAMEELLPNGKHIAKAKQLLKSKKKAFGLHQPKFLSLHRQLSHASMKAAPADWVPPHAEKAVDLYFEALHGHAHAFDNLVAAHSELGETFIAGPYQMLLEAILKGKNTGFGSSDPALRRASAKSILEAGLKEARVKLAAKKEACQCDQERAKYEYLYCLGSVIGKAAQAIILQYFSEDLVFEPPELSAFEKQVQAAAYRHLADFLEELEMPLEGLDEHFPALLERQILADVNHFLQPTHHSLPHELAEYFLQRHASLMQL